MVKQRQGYQFIIHEPAKTWIAEGKCAGCGKPQSEWKRSLRWKCCSTECTEKYVRECTSFGWGEYRLRVFRRDNFICAKCGKKPTPTRIEFEKTYNNNGEHVGWKPNTVIIDEPTEYDYASLLVADHIHPIAMGGEEWDMNNIQTLCKICNKHKTKNDAGSIAKLRLKEKFVNAGQKLLEEVDEDAEENDRIL